MGGRGTCGLKGWRACGWAWYLCLKGWRACGWVWYLWPEEVESLWVGVVPVACRGGELVGGRGTCGLKGWRACGWAWYLWPEGVESLWVGVVPLASLILSYRSPGALRLQPEYQLYSTNFLISGPLIVLKYKKNIGAIIM